MTTSSSGAPMDPLGSSTYTSLVPRVPRHVPLSGGYLPFGVPPRHARREQYLLCPGRYPEEACRSCPRVTFSPSPSAHSSPLLLMAGSVASQRPGPGQAVLADLRWPQKRKWIMGLCFASVAPPSRSLSLSHSISSVSLSTSLSLSVSALCPCHSRSSLLHEPWPLAAHFAHSRRKPDFWPSSSGLLWTLSVPVEFSKSTSVV
jgi:hypothetical protein